MKRIRFALNALLILGIVVTSVQCVKKEQTNVNNPVAILYISPTSGTLTTVFTFDGSASHDGNNLSEGMMYRWDADSDGNYDLDWTTSSSVQVNFNVAGTFTVTMEVKTADGKTATDSKQVTVTDNGGGQLPTVTTTQVSGITQNTAMSGGNVTSDSGSAVTARGVCWSTSTNPTTSNSTTSDGTGTGSFTSNLTGLSENTTYFVRAYATNGEGTAYGNEVSFTTTGGGGNTFTDPRDGHVYSIVVVGTQVWFAENLNYGTRIDASQYSTDNGIVEKYCWNDDEAQCLVSGAYYSWEEMMQNYNFNNTGNLQGICPDGWHVPTDDEWEILEGFADTHFNYGDPEWDKQGYADTRGFDAGKHLKSTTTWGQWNSNNDNRFGFSVITSGRVKIGQGEFWDQNSSWIWTSTRYAPLSGSMFNRYFSGNDGIGRLSRSGYNSGYSVRCIKN